MSSFSLIIRDFTIEANKKAILINIKRQIEDNKPGLIQFFQDIYEDMSVDTEEDEKLFKELGSILEELQKI